MDKMPLTGSILKVLFLLAAIGVQAVFAAKHSVAVLPSDEEEGVFKPSELKFFTDKAQEIAVKVLPQSDFDVVQQSVIIKRLGGADNYMKECKESSCIVELGRKAMVDYVAQCSFTKLSGSDFTVTFELYNVSTEGLIDKFTETAKNFNGLRAIVEKRIPEGFKKIPGVSPVGGETSGTKNDAEAYYKRGVEYYEKKDYDKAISEFTEAIRLNPKYAEAYYIRGRMYILKEDYDIAISDLNEAIRLKRNYAEAYKMRGFTYRLKGDYDKAISDLNEAIRLNPKILSDLQNALENIRGGMFTDSRDGKKYKTIKIGSQTWMAENLNYAANGSKCYDNKPENCKKYGRLYDWATAKKVCPSGWHLPSKSEYEVLDKAVGGEEVAGKKLKAKSGWDSYQGKSGNGTDDFGFSALPGGCGYSNGSFDNVGYYGYWWSAGERRIYTYGRLMRPTCRAMWDDEEAGLLSVRCLQD